MISVITVCYNREKTIADTLRSVEMQDHPDVEHIIIDGASTDRTLERISHTPNRVSHILSEPDHGIYDAMNKGLECASGEIVGFLNSDDFYADTHVLSRIAKAFSRPDVDCVYGDVQFVAQEDIRRQVRYWKAGVFNRRRLQSGWMPPHPTFYVRRGIYDQYGHFDLRYRLQGDYEMALRLLKDGGLNLKYIPKTLVRMRMGGASNSSVGNVIRGNLEAYHAARMHGFAVSPLFPFKKVLSKLPQFRHMSI